MPDESYRKGVEDAVAILMKVHPMWAAFILRTLLEGKDATKDATGS